MCVCVCVRTLPENLFEAFVKRNYSNLRASNARMLLPFISSSRSTNYPNYFFLRVVYKEFLKRLWIEMAIYCRSIAIYCVKFSIVFNLTFYRFIARSADHFSVLN